MTPLISVAVTDSLIFDSLAPQPADALLALIGLHRADPRAGKIDVGVGVYRDETGATPVFRSVKAAERRLLGDQDTKAYLGPEGDECFTSLLAPIALGRTLAASDRVTGVQTPGGSGALRLGAELVARAAPGRRAWMGIPTWPNHAPIFDEAGLSPQAHPYVDAAASAVDFAGMVATLGKAERGDVVLLHGCCHNPTGADLTLAQWRELAALIALRGLVPFVDIAYQGLGGGLAQDHVGLQLVVEAAAESLVAYSCDKNFGLYRERVGALWVFGASAAAMPTVRANILTLARGLWSMPPDHGAAIVRTILDDPALEADWRDELEMMRRRIADLRRLLAAAHPALRAIGRQYGMFAMLPIDAAAVDQVRREHGIYMAGSGRIKRGRPFVRKPSRRSSRHLLPSSSNNLGDTG